MADLIAGMSNAYPKSYSVYSQNTKPVQTPQTQTNKKKGMNTTTKVLIGTGLTALAAAGIYLATRGKKVINPVAAQTTVTVPTPVAEAVSQTIDKFKSIGKFVKGKAITNSGENFTGLLTKELKDGSKLVLDYKDGILQTSSKLKGEAKIFEKIFTHNEKGVLTNVVKNGENIFNKQFFQNGDMLVKGSKSKIYSAFDEQGKLYGRFIDIDNGGRVVKNIYKPDGSVIKQVKINKLKGTFESQYVNKDGQNVIMTNQQGGDMIQYLNRCDDGQVLINGTPRALNMNLDEQVLNNMKEKYGSIYHRAGLTDNTLLTSSLPKDVKMSYENEFLLMGTDKPNFSIVKDVKLKTDGTRVVRYDSAIRKDPRHIVREKGSDVLQLFDKDKQIGLYNTKTKQFSSLDGITEGEAKKYIDEISEYTQKLKGHILEGYQTERYVRAADSNLKNAIKANNVRF